MTVDQCRELARALTNRRDASYDLVGAIAEADYKVLQLAVRETDEAFDRRCEELAERCGLAAYLWDRSGSFTPDDARKAVVDTFLVGALEEFDSGTHLALDASWEMFALGRVLRQLSLDMNTENDWGHAGVDRLELDRQQHMVTIACWESFELTLYRLCGAWDRAAQVLAYVFFNMREFDRDTFPAVVERLKTNYAMGDPLFEAHASWQALRRYTEDGSERGHAALVRRRNVLTHSIGLDYGMTSSRHAGADASRPMNSLDIKRARKLQQLNPEAEIARVTQYCQNLISLRIEVVGLCHFGMATHGLRPQRFRGEP